MQALATVGRHRSAGRRTGRRRRAPCVTARMVVAAQHGLDKEVPRVVSWLARADRAVKRSLDKADMWWLLISGTVDRRRRRRWATRGLDGQLWLIRALVAWNL